MFMSHETYPFLYHMMSDCRVIFPCLYVLLTHSLTRFIVIVHSHTMLDGCVGNRIPSVSSEIYTCLALIQLEKDMTNLVNNSNHLKNNQVFFPCTLSCIPDFLKTNLRLICCLSLEETQRSKFLETILDSA